jgi:hypothetical protein
MVAVSAPQRQLAGGPSPPDPSDEFLDEPGMHLRSGGRELGISLAAVGHGLLDLRTHPLTRSLVEEPSPLDRHAYKRREDLLDAVICSWTASFWHRHGLRRCQVLGADDGAASTISLATIIAAARPEQRRP